VGEVIILIVTLVVKYHPYSIILLNSLWKTVYER